MNTAKTVRLHVQEKDNIMYFSLPATEGMTGQEWIDHLVSKGFNVDIPTKKIILENLEPTMGTTVKVALITPQTILGSRYIESACRHAVLNHFTRLSLEHACQLRDLVSATQLREMGLDAITILFEDIKTEKPQYPIPGIPQCILIGIHDLCRDYFFSLPYRNYDDIGERNGIAFAVSPLS
jgi:hypothetical protein